MMHQCSTSELLTGAALVHHDDKCHLLATFVIKGLIPERYGIVVQPGRGEEPLLSLCGA